MDDSEIWFVDDFSILSGLDRDETLELEVQIYCLLDYKVHISQDEYRNFVCFEETKVANDIGEGTINAIPESKITKIKDF